MAEQRVGVAAALVEGTVVAGDVAVDASEGTVTAVGLPTDAPGGLAVPGFVDLQVNGLGDVDLRRADPEQVGEVALALAHRGVTAFAPTLHSCDLATFRRALVLLGRVRSPRGAAQLLPAHLEGPHLSRNRRGAHDPDLIVDGGTGDLDGLLDAGPVSMVTLAPEVPGGIDAVRRIVRRGAVASIGHSDADTATVRRAVGAGARHVTHCWNALVPPTAREPGPVGVALDDPDLTVGLIADLTHVLPEMVRLTFAAAAGRVAATGDLVASRGADRRVRDGAVRSLDGALLGGATALDGCLANLVGVGIDLAVAVDACGGAQRRLLGLPEVSMRPGDPADIAVLADDLSVTACLVAGRVA